MKHILFLQSPLGTFFKHLAQHFSSQQHCTYKINLNGGDRVYAWADKVYDYTGLAKDWSDYLNAFYKEHKITDIVVYGDCRYYHSVAISLAKACGIKVWCFEEGYLRAGFVTLEENGCNANSELDLDLVKINNTDAKTVKSTANVGPTFKKRLWYGFRYYVEYQRQNKSFINYIHHRPWTSWQECFFWLSNFRQKWSSMLVDRLTKRKLISKHRGNIYLLPLQVRVDFQLRQHSPFASVEEVIKQVIHSFATNSEKDKVLVIKHHPQDRGFISYQKLIKGLTSFYKLEGRVFYVHELNLPKVYPYLRGVVTVNSTVGLSSLLHSIPTIALGSALYDLPGTTFQGSLDDFWKSSYRVNSKFFAKFHTYLMQETQLSGDFYTERQQLLTLCYQKMCRTNDDIKTVQKIA
ncbi:capsule biosynthesis protein [Thalassotalea sp. PS06]|uniref:capsule biosynthesis protein n=1 Tax=Thalassotalea sp. PS06 TaxID=2594005 RepID=UPI0011649F4E|nr:capsular biosynthesis protein [Thalassotalea sp. PS06]QDP01937.1 capsular biosynthesis protein [Thalassotalea sp. PS06]